MTDDNADPDPARSHGQGADGTPPGDAEPILGAGVAELLARLHVTDAPDAAREILRGARDHVLAHPTYTSAEADDILGSQGAAFTAAFAGTLISLDDHGIMRVPAFQIDLERGRVRPVVSEANALLGAGDDPWGCASWWLSESGWLSEGMSPADAVEASTGFDALLIRIAGDVEAKRVPTTLPMTGITLDEARERLRVLHFARGLSDQERELVEIGWGMLRLLDLRLAGGGTAR